MFYFGFATPGKVVAVVFQDCRQNAIAWSKGDGVRQQVHSFRSITHWNHHIAIAIPPYKIPDNPSRFLVALRTETRVKASTAMNIRVVGLNLLKKIADNFEGFSTGSII